MNDFPRQAWVLQPSFRPKQVTLVELVGYHDRHAATDTGKWYLLAETYDTKAEAIAAGWKRVNGMQEALDKKVANLVKRRAALTKAEAEAA